MQFDDNTPAGFTPKNSTWYKSVLPRETAATQKLDPDSFYRALRSLNERGLEVSNLSRYARGLGVMVMLPFIFLAIKFGSFYIKIIFEFSKLSFGWGAWSFFMSAVLILIVAFYIWLIRFDCSIPRDLPVRFDRAQRKVYFYQFVQQYNPFGRWKPKIDVANWDDCQAEISIVRTVIGGAYVTRYALELVELKPGSATDVLRRLPIFANEGLPNLLPGRWNTICAFMEHGLAALPADKPDNYVPQGVSFYRSFFKYAAFIAPGSIGKEFWKNIAPSSWKKPSEVIGFLLMLIMVVIMVCLLPFLLLWGVCHFIAMWFAPEPDWSLADGL